VTITGTGGTVVIIARAPRTARALGLAIGERTAGPVFLAADGRRPGRHAAGRIVAGTARGAGIARLITPRTLRHVLRHRRARRRGPAARCPGRRLARGPADRDAAGLAAAWTGMPPTSSPPASRAPPGNRGAGLPPGGESRQEDKPGIDTGNDHAPLLRREREAPFGVVVSGWALPCRRAHVRRCGAWAGAGD